MTAAALPAVAPGGGRGRGGAAAAIARAAALGAVGAATVGAIALGGGRPAAAVAPVVLAAALWAMWRLPLRVSAAALLFLVLALDRTSDAQGAFHTPLALLGDLLRHNVDHTVFPGSKLKLSGMELLLLYMLLLVAVRSARHDPIDARGRVPAPTAVRHFVLLYVAAIAVATAWGLARRGSIDHAIVQVRPLLHIPVLFWVFQAAFRGPADHVLLGRIVVLAACCKAALATAADLTVGRAWAGPGKWACATNHGDSILFALACVVLVASALERPDRARIARAAVLLPVLFVGMAANHRRLAWVDLGLALAAVHLALPWARWRRGVTRAAAVLAPLALLYVAAGWSSTSPAFAPIRVLRTVSDGGVDRSTLYRDVENWNLAMSIREAPVLGTGFGHEYTIFLEGDDISSVFELYRVEPHNSVLGLILFGGLWGFTAMWLLLAATVFLAVRAHRLARVPEDRAAAACCVAAVVVLGVQAYGDLGQFFTQFPVFAGLAVAVSAKLAVATGAWPARPPRAPRGLLPLAALLALCAPRAVPAAEGAPALAPIYDAARGLAPGWRDWGWTPHDLRRGAPASLDLSGYGGLVLAHPGLEGTFTGLRFRYRAPARHGEFLEVRLEDGSGAPLARVHVPPDRGTALPDGFVEVWLPMAELNPQGAPFERVVFHAWRRVDGERVLLDDVGLGVGPPPPPAAPRPGRFAVECGAGARPISPLVYGIGGMSDRVPHRWETGATARRWGGNGASRYNWRLGDAWNTSSDWFFRNVALGGAPGFGWESFLEENRAHGAASALTVPMLGWVAKDTSSYAFPVSAFGPQRAVAPELPDAGDGVGRDGRPLRPGPPERTSVRSGPGDVERWVREIRARDRGRGRSVSLYLLDNEPMLWSETHRDVHPEPATYDELLEKTLAYAAAIRRADPEATIGGPAEWGWLGYHYSAKDKAAGLALRPDRRAHGDVPLLAWYLREIAEHERRTGARVLDVLDVHYYPAARGVGLGTAGGTDPATAALRLRATRSLWDPTYVDESWIGERIRLIPRLREWVAEQHPGLKLSLGEWNFGAERHMSGGLAVAEALGRFGTEGLDHAYYWTVPPDRSPAFWAFRAYRNFDGRGGRFQDLSVPVRAEAALASLFASRDARGERLVLVLLNLDPRVPLEARVDLAACGRVEAARAFRYGGGEAGFGRAEATRGDGDVHLLAPPYTITVLDLGLAPAAR